VGYKSKLGSIDCRHFLQGSGNCPFGTSCFYRHAYPDGTLDAKDPSALRRYLDKVNVMCLSLKVIGYQDSELFSTSGSPETGCIHFFMQEGEVHIIGGVRLSDFLEMGTRGRRILEGASSNRRGTRTR
jgi:hypothetical protein